MKCCTIYKNYCYEFYVSDKSVGYIQGLASIEGNIWACIYRALENVDLRRQSSTLDSPTNETQYLQDVTPGGPNDTPTQRVEAFAPDSDYLKDLLLDVEAYRSLSPLKYEEGTLLSPNYIEKNSRDSRNTILCKMEWDTKNFDSEDDFNEEQMIIYYATDLIL